MTVLDIGGEGRHPQAWNLNPRRRRTLGTSRGELIARHIAGRAEAIPFADRSLELIIVEKTPLRPAALAEIRRVIHPRGTVVLRHAAMPGRDPHALAIGLFPGRVTRCWVQLAGHLVRETVFELTAEPAAQSALGECP